MKVFIPGKPATKGSTRSFPHAKTGKIVTVSDAKGLKGWQQRIALAVAPHWPRVTDAPVRLDIDFHVLRPKSHFGTGRNIKRLKASAPYEHGRKPDLDKLIRAVLDALTGIVYRDDSQVCWLLAQKRYSEKSGVQLMIHAEED